MKAEVLTIGDELLRGEITDSNKSFLSQRLLTLTPHRPRVLPAEVDGGVVAVINRNRVAVGLKGSQPGSASSSSGSEAEKRSRVGMSPFASR